MSPTANRLTQDTLIHTLAAIRDTLDHFNDRMEKDERHRDAAEQAELMYQRRLDSDVKRAT